MTFGKGAFYPLGMQTPDRPVLTVLVPLFNEAGNIAPLAREIATALEGGPVWELIFVDDGSADGSAGEADAAVADIPGARVLRHAERAGKSAALWTGFKAARGGWIQLLDGDGQNDPADMRRVWDEIITPGAPDDLGLIAGRRTKRNDGGVKWLSSRLANGIRGALLRDDSADTGCGFKLIRSDAARDLAYFGGMHRFLPALVKRAGWRVREVKVNDRPRGAGASKYGFFGRLGAGIVDVLGVMWLVRRGRFGRLEED